MGSFDCGQNKRNCGLPTVTEINTLIDPRYHGLYCDEGVIILDNSTPRKGDKLHKKIIAPQEKGINYIKR